MRDVVITGVGAVTCHGVGTAALWQAMCQAPVRLPDRLPDPYAPGQHPYMYLAPPDPLPEAPGAASRLAVAAATEALDAAGLPAGTHPPTPLNVVVGTCMGETGREEQRRAAGGTPGPEPTFSVATELGDRLRATGVNTSVSNACAASGYALGIAADMIRVGEADLVLAGGADAYSRVAVGCFDRMRAADSVRCRPFDRHRQGTVFGEGAAMLVLESAEHAVARGAVPLARLGRSGWSCDAYHPTAPEPSAEQIVRAMRQALGEDAPDDAGMTGGRLGCVIPHGTGTKLNDVVESQALRQVLGAAVLDVPLYSLKALIGHTGGAAAALAAVAATLILRHGTVPPNVPLDSQDPECKVFLPHVPSPLAARRLLVNAYAFGGNNTSFLIESGDAA
ncbi:beta-ketoacyl synthase N-terminal-like domain-containing protein [Micromonospora sp. NPDC049230]|uniref:beta-ketoacyl-[acyl-carrier-protein] synthase family protein n=1 Tax=Micromonospora sp. NPDC049230 TaxID=3155502 RepID=UPI0033DFECAB